MRNYRSAMKYYRKRPAKRRRQRRKLPAIAIFLIAFTATFAMTEAYLAGWLDNLGTSTGLFAGALTPEARSASSLAPLFATRSAAPPAPRVAPLPSIRSATRSSSPPRERARFSFCHLGGGYNCVVDGDTIWFKGTKIRIADIDAPETHDYKCLFEKNLGDQATIRLHNLLQSGAISFEPVDRDVDRYGRKLRIVLVDGVSVGQTLVDERLARWYAGGRRPWC